MQPFLGATGGVGVVLNGLSTLSPPSLPKRVFDINLRVRGRNKLQNRLSTIGLPTLWCCACHCIPKNRHDLTDWHHHMLTHGLVIHRQGREVLKSFRPLHVRLLWIPYTCLVYHWPGPGGEMGNVGLLPFRRVHPTVEVAGGARSRASKI